MGCGRARHCQREGVLERTEPSFPVPNWMEPAVRKSKEGTSGETPPPPRAAAIGCCAGLALRGGGLILEYEYQVQGFGRLQSAQARAGAGALPCGAAGGAGGAQSAA